MFAINLFFLFAFIALPKRVKLCTFSARKSTKKRRSSDARARLGSPPDPLGLPLGHFRLIFLTPPVSQAAKNQTPMTCCLCRCWFTLVLEKVTDERLALQAFLNAGFVLCYVILQVFLIRFCFMLHCFASVFN